MYKIMEGPSLPILRSSSSEDLEIPMPQVRKTESRTPSSKDFAGEGWSGCKIRQVYLYKLSGQLPREFDYIYDNVKYNGKKTCFLDKCKRYSISKTCISELSRSKLLYKSENVEFERVVPYFDEVEKILNWVHIDNEVHLEEKKSLERALAAKVFWHGYTKDIRNFIMKCSCKCMKGQRRKKKGEDEELKQ